MFEQEFALNSPWNSKVLSYTEAPSSYSESYYLLIYNKQTLKNSLEVTSEMSGNIYSFSVSGTGEYAKTTQTSSQSTSVSVMMKDNIKTPYTPTIIHRVGPNDD